MMKQFKGKKKHLTGEICDFPKRVVQAMVDEQVRQGNPADPSVFSVKCVAGKIHGGFNWHESTLGHASWVKIMAWKHFHLIPNAKNRAKNRAAQIAHPAPKRRRMRLSNTCWTKAWLCGLAVRTNRTTRRGLI